MKIQADILAAGLGVFFFINLYLWGVVFAACMMAGLGLVWYVGRHAERFSGRGNGTGGKKMRAWYK